MIPVELLLGCIASIILGFLGFICRFRSNTISVWHGNFDQSAEKVSETVIEKPFTTTTLPCTTHRPLLTQLERV